MKILKRSHCSYKAEGDDLAKRIKGGEYYQPREQRGEGY